MVLSLEGVVLPPLQASWQHVAAPRNNRGQWGGGALVALGTRREVGRRLLRVWGVAQRASVVWLRADRTHGALH